MAGWAGLGGATVSLRVVDPQPFPCVWWNHNHILVWWNHKTTTKQNKKQQVETQASRVEAVLRKKDEHMVGAFVEEFKRSEAILNSLHTDVAHLKKGYRALGTRLAGVEHNLEVATNAIAAAETICSIVKQSPGFQAAVTSVMVETGSPTAAPTMPSDDTVALARRFVDAVPPAVEATEAAAVALSAVGVSRRPATARGHDLAKRMAELGEHAGLLEGMTACQDTVESVAPTGELVNKAARVRAAIKSATSAVALAAQLGGAATRHPTDRELHTRFESAATRAAGAMELATESQKALLAEVLDPVVASLALLGGLHRRVKDVTGRFEGVGVEEAVAEASWAAVRSAQGAVDAAEELKGTVVERRTGTVLPEVIGSVANMFDASTGELAVETTSGAAGAGAGGAPGGGGTGASSQGEGKTAPTAPSEGVLSQQPGPRFVLAVRTALKRTINAEAAVSRLYRVARMRQAARLRCVNASLEVARAACRLARVEERFHMEKARDLACGEAPATLEGIMIASTLLTTAKDLDLSRAKDADAALRTAAAAGADAVELDQLVDIVRATRCAGCWVCDCCCCCWWCVCVCASQVEV